MDSDSEEERRRQKRREAKKKKRQEAAQAKWEEAEECEDPPRKKRKAPSEIENDAPEAPKQTTKKRSKRNDIQDAVSTSNNIMKKPQALEANEDNDGCPIIHAAKTKGSDDADFVVRKSAAKQQLVSAADESTYTVFVGGLPSHVDEAMLERDFGECGEMVKVTLSRWPQDGSSKGMAWLEFETTEARETCLEWNHTVYERKTIRIEKSKPPKRDVGRGGQHGDKPLGCLTVVILQLHEDVNEDDLHRFFAKCGNITGLKILRHRETKESRGIAFVDFETTEMTDEAVMRNGDRIRGKDCIIQWAAPKNDSRSRGSNGPITTEKPLGCTTVVVRNLSQSASEDDLWDMFKGCATLNNVNILRDKETFRSKGVAFLDFDESGDTDKAIKLNGRELYGQSMEVVFKR